MAKVYTSPISIYKKSQITEKWSFTPEKLSSAAWDLNVEHPKVGLLATCYVHSGI